MNRFVLQAAGVGAAWLARGGAQKVSGAVQRAFGGGRIHPVEDWCRRTGMVILDRDEDSYFIRTRFGTHVMIGIPSPKRLLAISLTPIRSDSYDPSLAGLVETVCELRNRKNGTELWSVQRGEDRVSARLCLDVQLSGMNAQKFDKLCECMAEEMQLIENHFRSRGFTVGYGS